MIEFFDKSALEFIIFCTVIFIVIVYLERRLNMETIWGDILDATGENLPTSDKDYELNEDIEKGHYEDNSDYTSDTGYLHFIDNSNNTIDEGIFETSKRLCEDATDGEASNINNNSNEAVNTTSAQINIENTEYKDYQNNKVNGERPIDELSFIESENETTDKEIFKKTDSLKTTLEALENTADEIESKEYLNENTDYKENYQNNKVNGESPIDKVNFVESENETIDEAFKNTDSIETTLESFKNTADEIKEDINTSEVLINDGSDFDVSGDENKKYIITVPKFALINENEVYSSIKILDISNKMSRVYEVHGSSFVEGEHFSQHNEDELVRYNLYRMDETATDDNDDMVTTLDMHVQMLPQGVIINSNVFLWDTQWNTMVLVDENQFHCAVCQVYCDKLTCLDHVETLAHIGNLDKYKPLKRFDLSIVRKININLHCGVCNNIFNEIDYSTHENSKNHEENFLTAINKVSDLMYDSNIHLTYNNRNFHSVHRNTLLYGRNASSSDINASTSRRNPSSSDRISRNIDEFHYDANAINKINVNKKQDKSSEEELSVKEIEVEEESSENEEDDEDNFYEKEYNTPFQGVSYASMASKPILELPKSLNIDLGNKEFRVKFDSWNMITKIESNKFYCMVCNRKDLMRYKSQHCISCEHVEKLAKCTTVDAFQDYLIRKVDNRLYHCGHCNNLQHQDQMEYHIESAHSKINRNFVETISSQRTTKKTDKINKTVIEAKKTESDKSTITNKNIEFKMERQEPLRHPHFDIFGDIPLTPFDCELRIPALNFNLIMKKDEGYYCVICDIIPTDVKIHIEELEHMELMTITPFIKPFQNNLTRAVRGNLHCSLCNVLFSVSEVYNHNIDQPHTTALATAMGMTKTQRPENTNRVTILNLDGQNTSSIQTAPFNLPSIQTTAPNVTEIPKDNLKLVTLNQGITQKTIPISPNLSAQKSNVTPEIGQDTLFPILGQNLMTLLKIGQNLPNAEHSLLPSGQNEPQDEQNMPQAIQKVLQTEQAVPQAGQYMPRAGQNLPQAGQNIPQARLESLPDSGDNLSKFYSNLPSSQNLNIENIKSIPLVSNLTFPLLPPIKNPDNNFLAPPPTYSVNVPCPPVSPLSDISSNSSSYLLSPTTSTPRKQKERKTIIISDNKVSVSGSDNSKTDTDDISQDRLIFRSNSDNIRRGRAYSRSGNDSMRRDRINSRSVSINIRQDRDNSRPNSDIIKRDRHNLRCDSDNTRPGRDNSRCDSDNTRTRIDSFKSGRRDSKSGIDNGSYSMENDSQSDDDELKEFDEEEMVFVKFKTTYFKITNMSYNTLVFLDNGIRYCFACSSIVYTSQEHRHVESRKHMDCLSDNKFLDKYGMQLFRQMYLMYHCAICNELMTRKEIKLHLDWAIHEENYNISHLVLNKKNRKELKSGLKEYVVETQKEAIFHNVTEPNYHIRTAYQIVPNLDVKKDALQSKPTKESESPLVKKNKMVIQNNVVMKVGFDHWHGITFAKNVTKCVICQEELTTDQVLDHVETDYHRVGLGKTFEKSFYPALVRKINEFTVNCMTCNLELPNNEHMIQEHVNGRKHNKNKENIINETSNSDSYTDCYEDFLNL